MAASWDTVTEIHLVLKKHCTPLQVTAILQDLSLIKGNASFIETVKRLRAYAY